MNVKNREGFMGGSDAAAGLGMDRWTTPVELWMEKIGQPTNLAPHEDEDNLPADLGQDMEDWVAQRYATRENIKLRRVNRELTHPTLPWMVGHIDRKIEGQQTGVEIKVTQRWQDWGKKPDKFPVGYYLQCLHYMIVSGYSKWVLVALILNGQRSEMLSYEIQPPPEVLDSVVEREQTFWKHVEDRTPPPPRTQEDLNLLYPTGQLNESRYADTELAEAVRTLRETKANLKSLKDVEEALQFQIKGFMQNATELYDPLGKALLITWKKNKDSEKTDWYKVARSLILASTLNELGESEIQKEMAQAAQNAEAVHTITGARVLLLKGGKK